MDFSRLDVPNLKAELRAQDRRRYLDPDVLPNMPKIWVAYLWQENHSRWILLGFVRTPWLKLPRVAKIRKNFRVKEAEVMLLLELMLAAKSGGPVAPPSRAIPTIIPSKKTRRSA